MEQKMLNTTRSNNKIKRRPTLNIGKKWTSESDVEQVYWLKITRSFLWYQQEAHGASSLT